MITEDRILQFIADETGLLLKSSDVLDDYFDSLELVDLALELSAAFHVEIDRSDYRAYVTVQDLINAVQRATVAS